MDKKYLLLLIPATFLLGFITRGGFDYLFNDHSVASQESGASVTRSEAKLSAGVADSNFQGPGKESSNEGAGHPVESNLVTVPYDANDPFSRLNALEEVTYPVPGYAISKLIPRVFDYSDGLSSEMKFVMKLGPEEEDQFNQLLDETNGKIREIEAEFVKDRVEQKSGDEFIFIPSFAARGEQIRKDLLDRIETDMGHERRQIFEMIMLNQSAAFGNYGKQDLVLRNPKVEMVNGRHEMVTIELGTLVGQGTDAERFEGTERIFSRAAFEKRFGHLYVLDE